MLIILSQPISHALTTIDLKQARREQKISEAINYENKFKGACLQDLCGSS